MTKVVYTQSGSRYLLDRKAMTCTDARGRIFQLVEWPEIIVGIRLIMQVRGDDGKPREMMTSEVKHAI